MTNKEKFFSVIDYLPNPQIPIVHFRYWDETIDKWTQEGHIKKEDNQCVLSKKLGFNFENVQYYCEQLRKAVAK